MWERREEKKECLNNIRTQEGWDRVTNSEAYGLSMHRQELRFLHFSEFFSELMPEADILYSVLQKRNIDAAGNRAKDVFQKNRERADVIVQENGAEGNRRRKTTNTAAVMKEACDTALSQVKDRLAKSDHVIAEKLIDCTLFPELVQSFAEAELECALKLWPINNKAKLKTELKSLYQHSELSNGNNTALSLLKSIHENNLQEALSETVPLLQIIITTPMTSAESERNFSTLKRIKTFTRNTMGQQRLIALAMLSVESEFIHGLLDFNNKVIEKFAHVKDRRASFLFKK